MENILPEPARHRKHCLTLPPILSSLMADRLIHKNDEMDTAPFVDGQNELKFYDPVEKNDYL